MSDIWPIIRSANPEDVQPAFKLMTELGYPGLSFARFVEVYHAVLENPMMHILVAEEENGEIIGLASITQRPQLRLTGKLVTLDELVVADHARARGVGKRLLETAQAMARKLGARRFELETNRARESYRRAFYVKNGLTEADSAVMRRDYDLDS